MQVIDPRATNNMIFALVYGGSGTGKTHLIGTLGALGRVLVIDVDQGYQTLTNIKVPGITQAMRNNITIVSFDQFTDLNQAYHLTEKNDPVEWTKAFRVRGVDEDQQTVIDKPFDWIVWDTWSELQWYMMQQLRKNEQLLSPNMGKEIDFRKNVQIQHWGMLTDLNKLAIEQLRDCTQRRVVNQVFTMQEKIDKNDDLGTVEKGPAIHGKMMGEMPAYFDIVVHTYTNPNGTFGATTKRKANWPAKTRRGEGQDYDNPTAKAVFEL